jgi:hypothetical protein
MQSSFRPVAFRLSLSEVAALAEATARVLLGTQRATPRFAFAFRLCVRLPAIGDIRDPRSGDGIGKPEPI